MILISVTLIVKELSFYAGVIFDSYQKLHVLVKKTTLIVLVCFPRKCFFLENFVYLCTFLQTFISEFTLELKYVHPLLEWARLSETGVVYQLGPAFLKKTFIFESCPFLTPSQNKRAKKMARSTLNGHELGVGLRVFKGTIVRKPSVLIHLL